MISNYRPAIHKTMFIYLTDGSLKIFFQGQCWFLGIFPVCVDFRTEHPARGPKRLHLVEMGRGAKRQAWRSFLKAKGNIEKGKEKTTSLNFGVTSFATPCNLGKEVVACKWAQSLGTGHAGAVTLLAGHLLRASINDTPRLLLESLGMASPEEPPFPTEMPPAPLTTVYVFGGPEAAPLQLDSGSPGAQETSLRSDKDWESGWLPIVMTHSHPTNRNCFAKE